MSPAVMDTAERYREFIACLTTKRTRLHEPQMMRIGRLAAAQSARLEANVAQMLAAAVPPWRSDREDALIDAGRLIAPPAGRCRLRLRGLLSRYPAVALVSLV